MAKMESTTRRVFLKRLAALSAMGGAAPMALNLAAVGEAAAIGSSDYKALVCVFLNGGNDHANTVVPYDLTNYTAYSNIRGAIAHEHSALTNTVLGAPSQVLTDDLQYALAPGLTGLRDLWNAGQCAVLLNVGPLVRPRTLKEFNTGTFLPPRLFSHNDQQAIWQSMATESQTTSGWGGRLGELAMSSNGKSALTCISAGGNALYLSGDEVLQYQVGLNGPMLIEPAEYNWWGSASSASTVRDLITRCSDNLLENELAKVTRRSIDLGQYVRQALSGLTLNTSFNVDGQPNPLADQLKIVARLIGVRDSLKVSRQVFFVQLGGFDLHSNLRDEHSRLMALLNEGLTQFQAAMVELGTEDLVTTFTASDFGRTLASNGDGSDHGWGSHHFILGGAVHGGRYYGTAPHVSVKTEDQVGQGRLLPSTSVDQFAATLARWFGASSTDLATLFPNLGYFSSSNLGFMVT